MEIAFDKFRCFGERQSARIAPVTLLVGENSAGKSTFMAGLRYILDFVQRSAAPSFNKDPFFLGGYKNIAHYRGGSYGRAASFSIEMSETLSISEAKLRQQDLFPPNEAPPRALEFSMEFSDLDGDATPISYNIKIPNRSVTISLEAKKVSAIVRDATRTFDHEISVRPISRPALSGSDFLVLDYVLRDLSLVRSRDATDPSDPAFVASSIVEGIWNIFRRLIARRRAQVYALAPVRTRPLRSYDPTQLSQSSEGDQLIAKLGRMARVDTTNWQKVRASLEAYGTATGLFESIRLHKLGRGDSDPFQIFVKAAGRETNIIDVGYGVSQVLPFLIILAELDQHSTLLIQQPEVHLHPSAQAALGSVIADAASKPRSPSFIIETHSDFIVDRARMAVRDGVLKPSDLTILFFEKEKYNSKITTVNITEKGEMVDAPKAYRDFFLREGMQIMGF